MPANCYAVGKVQMNEAGGSRPRNAPTGMGAFLLRGLGGNGAGLLVASNILIEGPAQVIRAIA